MNASPADPFASLHLEHSSTVDRVAEELRRAIFEGELESGTPLREVALAGSLQVSRPTVREALGALVAEGLLTREPNRGVSVTTPDPESIHDVCRARFVLEIAGVRSWNDAPEPSRQAVRDALAEFAAAAGTSGGGASYQTLNERHLAFHLSLVGLAGSPRLQAMAETLYAELRLALAQVDRARQNAPDQAGSHTLLVRLLESGDVEATVAELERHLAGAEVAILERLALPG
ncbi:GntR family transcriptional regulator [Nocardioides sp.]|uniref:GntR family transcriptional regulator n=1 Tax=Nocardioides sp. TaxID=35761 RepID=UPI002ED3F2DD